MRLLRFIAWYLAFSGIAALSLLVMSWPRHPSSAGEWLTLAVCALPVTLLGEGLGELLFGNRKSNTRKSSTQSRFSLWRVLVGVLFLAVVVGLILAIFIWMNQAPS